jgi:preprotein translocase subunit SecG
MFTFLLVVQALIAALLVGVILMQQSEGGGLGMGGSPSGLMSARGAANFLTKATAILAVTFVGLSIALAVLATQKTAPTTIDTSLANKPLPDAIPAAPAPAVPMSGAPVAPVGTSQAPATNAAPAPVVPMAAPIAQPQRRVAAPAPRTERAAPPVVTSTVSKPTPSITPAPINNPAPVGPPANSN